MPIVEYPQGSRFPGRIGLTTADSTPAWPEPVRTPEGAPDVLFFVLDDVGYGQLSTFGGLVETPNIDRVAAMGLPYASPFTFTGTIHEVVIDVGGELIEDHEAAYQRLTAQQ